MLIATALVLLMMLLFAQVFGLATETVSVRKGMAANDQKARLLTTRIDRDLTARTMRTVFPFAGQTFQYVPNEVGGVVVGWRPDYEEDEGFGLPVYLTPAAATAGNPNLRVPACRPVRGTLAGREGYFSVSENDPNDDRDDVISFTIDRRNRSHRGGVDYSPGLARAALLDTDALLFRDPVTQTVETDQPATDQFNVSGAGETEDLSDSPLMGGAFGNSVLPVTQPVGVSNYETVTFFLRDGNLIRARKLVREPDTPADLFDGPDVGNDPDPWPPTDGTVAVGGVNFSFARYFDYAAYSHPGTLAETPSDFGPRLHSEGGLRNEAGGGLLAVSFQNANALDDVRLPDSLGNPYLRDGAGAFPFDTLALAFPPRRPFGRPREFVLKTLGPSLGFADKANATGLIDAEWGGGFLGRYTLREQAAPSFHLPGRPVPGGAFVGPLFAPNLADVGGNPAPWSEQFSTSGVSSDRRGEEILLTNVHSFDVEVYDDALGDFADLGHDRTVLARDSYDTDNNGNTREGLNVAGDYHADRLIALTPTGGAALDIAGDANPELDYDGDGFPDPHPFGNRFDTWHPGMSLMSIGYVRDPATGNAVPVAVERPYPPPYRPLKNPLGGDLGVPTRDTNGNLVAVDLSFSVPAGGDGLVTREDLSEGLGLTKPLITTPKLLADYPDGFADAQMPTHTRPGQDFTLGDYARGKNGAGDERLFPDPNAYGTPGGGDEKPLRAVKITVRYYDVSSDRMREESFRHSLID